MVRLTIFASMNALAASTALVPVDAIPHPIMTTPDHRRRLGLDAPEPATLTYTTNHPNLASYEKLDIVDTPFVLTGTKVKVQLCVYEVLDSKLNPHYFAVYFTANKDAKNSDDWNILTTQEVVSSSKLKNWLSDYAKKFGQQYKIDNLSVSWVATAGVWHTIKASFDTVMSIVNKKVKVVGENLKANWQRLFPWLVKYCDSFAAKHKYKIAEINETIASALLSTRSSVERAFNDSAVKRILVQRIEDIVGAANNSTAHLVSRIYSGECHHNLSALIAEKTGMGRDPSDELADSFNKEALAMISKENASHLTSSAELCSFIVKRATAFPTVDLAGLTGSNQNDIRKKFKIAPYSQAIARLRGIFLKMVDAYLHELKEKDLEESKKRMAAQPAT